MDEGRYEDAKRIEEEFKQKQEEAEKEMQKVLGAGGMGGMFGGGYVKNSDT